MSALNSAQGALELRQADRSGIEEKLRTAQTRITSLNSRRAETQARLDELGARRAAQSERMEATKASIQEADDEVVRAEGEHRSAESALQKAEKTLDEAEADLESRKSEVARLEEEKRQKNEELAARQSRPITYGRPARSTGAGRAVAAGLCRRRALPVGCRAPVEAEGHARRVERLAGCARRTRNCHRRCTG